jgi:hypothetical protein
VVWFSMAGGDRNAFGRVVRGQHDRLAFVASEMRDPVPDGAGGFHVQAESVSSSSRMIGGSVMTAFPQIEVGQQLLCRGLICVARSPLRPPK